MLAARPDLDAVPHLAGWAEAGRPLIVRRFVPGETPTRLPLGLPLPPTDGKRRVGFAASPADAMPHTSPSLEEVRPVAPPAWQPTLDAVCNLGRRFGLVPRPFGSLLWQAETGLRYLTETSDLDLLWPLPTAVCPSGFLDRLAEIAATAPMRLDGELLLPDGGGIHWRELSEAPAEGEVLVKHLDHLDLRPASGLRAKEAA